MVKAVVGEETQLKLVEDRLSQSAVPAEVFTTFSYALVWSMKSLIRGFWFQFPSVSLLFNLQVGLVIGKLSSILDRGFVFDLIPTPQNDSGEPACAITDTSKDDKKKGSKSKSQGTDSSSLFIDRDWVAEHARQVR